MKMNIFIKIIFIYVICARDGANGATPVAPSCGANEQWNSCPPYCSFDTTCDQMIYGWVRECTTPKPDWQCTGRCECKPGFVRIGQNCVSPSNCCSDPNANFTKCPNPCPGGTCLQVNYSPCRATCRPWGCQCKPGYVQDADGKCILTSQCPNPCDESKNEMWNQCSDYCAFDRTCYMLFEGIRLNCTRPPPDWVCTGRCLCPSGFLRINSVCNPPSSCCTDPNSELVKCPNPCPGGTCEAPEFSPCKENCKLWGCQCKKGYVKDKEGKCIPFGECPKNCSVNEEWNPCPDYCTFDQTCDDSTSYEDCSPAPYNWKCTGRCVCSEGFVRIDGQCKDPNECPDV